MVVSFQLWIENLCLSILSRTEHWHCGIVDVPRLSVCLCAGLPVQVRDKALKIHDEIPKSDVGKEYYQQNLEREVCSDSITAF